MSTESGIMHERGDKYIIQGSGEVDEYMKYMQLI